MDERKAVKYHDRLVRALRSMAKHYLPARCECDACREVTDLLAELEADRP